MSKAGQKAFEYPALDSCESCKHFHERTTKLDDERWGECWHSPPEMVVEEGDSGEPVWVPMIPWHHLPYVCGEHKPRLQ
jgi:hypothetical protein